MNNLGSLLWCQQKASEVITSSNIPTNQILTTRVATFSPTSFLFPGFPQEPGACSWVAGMLGESRRSGHFLRESRDTAWPDEGQGLGNAPCGLAVLRNKERSGQQAAQEIEASLLLISSNLKQFPFSWCIPWVSRHGMTQLPPWTDAITFCPLDTYKSFLKFALSFNSTSVVTLRLRLVFSAWVTYFISFLLS